MLGYAAICGDITRTPKRASAIVALINPLGCWYGSVDKAITKTAGFQYHAQAAKVLNSSGLMNGQVIIADIKSPHKGNFDDVIFVVDDLKSPLDEIVYTALTAAHEAGYRHVALPLMRTGNALGVVEPTVEAVVDKIHQGVNRFQRQHSYSNLEITIVVYGNKEAIRLFSLT